MFNEVANDQDFEKKKTYSGTGQSRIRLLKFDINLTFIFNSEILQSYSYTDNFF